MIHVVGLRSPIAFRLPGPLTRESLTADLEAVAIVFESHEFIWHPPMRREIDGEIDDLGPMVSVLVPGVEDSPAVLEALQRFFSAVAFRFGEPVEDVIHGGVGGDDPWNPHGARTQRYFAATHVLDAPREIAVVPDEALWLALALYREGVNATSSIYRCLCFKNVLDAVFNVERETVRPGVVSAEANLRDKFINSRAGLFAEWHKVVPPASDWGTYFRDEIRNAAAHVVRAEGKRVLNPDRPRERVLLQSDASVLLNLAAEAIGERWPMPVTVIRRPD
jgi:hypothetical protein